RVAPVLEEDALVQVLGAFHPHRSGRVRHAGLGRAPGELVQENTAEGLPRGGIASEQRRFHHFGQVRQSEHRSVDVREVRGERGSFLSRERLEDHFRSHGRGDATARPRRLWGARGWARGWEPGWARPRERGWAREGGWGKERGWATVMGWGRAA